MLSVDRSVKTNVGDNRQKISSDFRIYKIYLLMAFYCHNYNDRCLLITIGNELTKGICYDNT